MERECKHLQGEHTQSLSSCCAGAGTGHTTYAFVHLQERITTSLSILPISAPCMYIAISDTYMQRLEYVSTMRLSRLYLRPCEAHSANYILRWECENPLPSHRTYQLSHLFPPHLSSLPTIYSSLPTRVEITDSRPRVRS